ncbi:carbon-nitrogen hydrolase [Candidatus Peregrinibacteria bacterium]|nr:carbon-nitrogen hydrolase [Candidatus Peregrinibacteria bacterium]
MTLVRLGLVQMKMDQAPQKNLQKALKSIQELAKKGAQIIVLPELFLSPYFCQEKNPKTFELAETIPGPTTEALMKVAGETKTVLVVSLFEKTVQKKYFNSIAMIGPDGKLLGTYHKMHIPSLPPDLYAENYYFEKGDEGFKVFDTPYGRIAPMICYDQWFPEGARVAAAKGAQILVYPTAIGWPLMDRAELNTAEHDAWQIIQRSHSIANNVFVTAVNRIGIEGNLNFWGTSFISDPYGRVLAKASTDREENIIVPLDLSVIDSMRAEWPFLDERRIRIE